MTGVLALGDTKVAAAGFSVWIRPSLTTTNPAVMVSRIWRRPPRLRGAGALQQGLVALGDGIGQVLNSAASTPISSAVFTNPAREVTRGHSLYLSNECADGLQRDQGDPRQGGGGSRQRTPSAMEMINALRCARAVRRLTR